MNRISVAQQSKVENSALSARGILQRKCACGERTTAGSECGECKKKSLNLQRRSASSNKPTEIPSIVHEVLGSPGQSLDAGVRMFMEPRFGHDFSNVKIHSDEKASESANSVNALAYTVGNHIVFRSGQYDPQSSRGRKLLAHELTHTVQQNNSYLSRKTLRIGEESNALEKNAAAIADQVVSYSPRPISIINGPSYIQRTCGSAAIGSVSGCVGLGGQDVSDLGFSSNDIYKFVKDCDDFLPGEAARVSSLASRISVGDTVDIHGFASEEGDASFNDNLACARAHAAADLIGSSVPVTLFKHGATEGLREDRRSVVIAINSTSLGKVDSTVSSISWIDASSPAGKRVNDPSPPSQITETFVTGSSGFRFSNYLHAWLDTKNSTHIVDSGFSPKSGIYQSPSFFNIPSKSFPIKRSSNSISRAGIDGIEFEQTVGARTVSPAVIGSRTGAGVGVIGGGILGAKIGGGGGSTLGPVGTAVGAVGGALVGGAAGFFTGAAVANRITNFPPIWTIMKLRLFANGDKECEVIDHSLFPSHSYYCDMARIGEYSALEIQQTSWENNGWDSGNPWGISRPLFTP